MSLEINTQASSDTVNARKIENAGEMPGAAMPPTNHGRNTPSTTTQRTSSKKLLLALIALLVLKGAADAQPCPAFRVRNSEGNYIIPGVKGDIPYSGDLALDAFVQPDGTRRPTIVVVHGGGWSSGSRIAHVGQILELLTRAGYNWVSVDYRLGGLARHPEALVDLRAALR
ncbi:MAG: alpha/beta hydrolase, partial [Acidobacteria bacterium]|nr:alpha/beta hydrolase [Acidobacteriota bacterium]